MGQTTVLIRLAVVLAFLAGLAFAQTPPSTPGTPRLTLTSCAGTATIGIAWPASTSTIPLQGYNVFHWTGSAWQSFAFVPAPTTTAQETTTANVPHYYAVNARDTGGHQSPLSAWGAITPQCAQPSLRIGLTCPSFAPVGTDLHVPLTASVGTTALGAYGITLTYDPGVLHVTGVTGATTGFFTATPTANPGDWTTGASKFASFQAGSLTGPTGTVPLGTVTFHVVGGPGTAPVIGLTIRTVGDTDARAIAGVLGLGCP